MRTDQDPGVAGPRGFHVKATLVFIFLALMGPLMDIGVRNTNKYARDKHKPRWKDTNRIEFTAFIGLLLWMGRKNLNRVDCFAPYPLGDAYARDIMTKTRFNELYSCWHFVDKTKATSEDKKNAFWQAMPMIKVLQGTFQKHFVSGREISIDEMTTPFKGRCKAKQYNPNKPNKWGLKDFAICCARTGYCIFFYPYQGRDQAKPADMSLGEFAVRQVLISCFWYAGYLVAMDNWFMCMGVVQFCISVGVHVVGTLRTGRTGFPSKSLLTLPNSADRGSCKVFQHSESGIFACVWKDNKLVRMISTFAFAIGTCVRRIKAEGYKTVDVPQPQCIGCYNTCMGGCDLGDQCKAYIRPTIRSRVICDSSFMPHILSCSARCAITCLKSSSWL